MAGKVRELSWSLSKARTFEECPRRFYYHYYYAQAGYAPGAPEDARLALEMKRIKGLDMWIGEVVHQTIQWALEQAQGGQVPSEADGKADARRRLSEGWKGSLKQLWRTLPDEQCPNLFEHYYGIQVGSAVTDRLKNKAFVSIENFLSSDVFKQIAAASKDRWLPIDRFASFRMDGLLFYVKFDFALKEEKHLTVYDWKTGKPTEGEARQLACYAMFASSTYGYPLESIKVCAAHLQPEFEGCERFVDEGEVEEARVFARDSFNAMVKLLHNPARNLARMEDFPMTGNLIRCVRCNYKGICEHGKQASGELDELEIVQDWGE